MPFNRPTLSELVERIRADFDANLPGADSRLRVSMLDVLARMHAGAMHGSYGQIEYLAKQILPDTQDSEYLTRHASIWLGGRKVAATATGQVIATGTNNAIIPAATVLVRSDGVRFITEQATEILAGTATIAISAEEAGTTGNCPVGQSLQLANPIAGIVANMIVTADAISGGAAEESDEVLRARLLLRIRNPAHGGNKTDYVNWALEVAGVTRAWCYPNWLGAGTVGVAFVMDGRIDPIPLPADVLAVQNYIDALRPVTAALTVFAPVARPMDVVIAAQPPTPAVQTAIAAELKDMLFREAQPGGTILISHIREAISIAPGEYDHELIAPNSNQYPNPGEMLVLGNITWA